MFTFASLSATLLSGHRALPLAPSSPRVDTASILAVSEHVAMARRERKSVMDFLPLTSC